MKILATLLEQLSTKEIDHANNLAAEYRSYVVLTQLNDARSYRTLFEGVSAKELATLTAKLNNFAERIAEEEKQRNNIEEQKKSAKETALKALQSIIKQQNLPITMEEVLGAADNGAGGSEKKRIVKPKYRLVEKGEVVCEWTGRGLKPKKIQAYLDKGGKIDKLLIKE